MILNILHALIAVCAAGILVRELSRLRASAMLGAEVPSTAHCGAPAATLAPAKPDPRKPPKPSTAGLIVVQTSRGWRLYRVRPGITRREEVEVFGSLVGWLDMGVGYSLPAGLELADVEGLPRAEREAPPRDIAVCVAAWSALPDGVRQSLRVLGAAKGPGVMRLWVSTVNASRDRAWAVERLAGAGLAVIEVDGDVEIWGRP